MHGSIRDLFEMKIMSLYVCLACPMTACQLQTSMQLFRDMSMMSSTCHLKLHMIIQLTKPTVTSGKHGSGQHDFKWHIIKLGHDRVSNTRVFVILFTITSILEWCCLKRVNKTLMLVTSNCTWFCWVQALSTSSWHDKLSPSSWKHAYNKHKFK